MQDELLNEEKMDISKPKTSPQLLEAIEGAAKSMLEKGLSEARFILPGTEVSLFLIKKGTESEVSRAKDLAATFGMEYKFGDSSFILSRR